MSSSIYVTIEFAVKTPIGIAERATIFHGVYGEPMREMEETVKWIQKAIKCDSIRRPMVTFSYMDEKEIGTVRLIEEYDGTYRVVTWDDKGNVTSDVKKEKADIRLLRKLYIHNADRRLVYETNIDREGA